MEIVAGVFLYNPQSSTCANTTAISLSVYASVVIYDGLPQNKSRIVFEATTTAQRNTTLPEATDK